MFQELWARIVGFRSRIGYIRLYLAFLPSGVGKWGPALAGKEKEIWFIPLADECGVFR